MEEDFKVKAPELYEAPDYTLPQFPPENPYERKGFAFDPSDANLEKFRNTIRAMRLIKERGGDENLRMGGVMNALVAINKKYDYIDPHEAYREFFGGDIPLDQAESELESIYAATEGSKDALGEFQKLDKARQEEIVRGQSPNAKKRIPVYDSMGLAIANPVRDNPDYDSEKERADYEAKLDKKNTWEGYLRIRNAFSPEIVRDAMRFKTAFDSRSEAADAYIDRFIEKGNEYREAFISAVSLLSPELKAGFWDRVKSRVGDSYTDTYQNIIDAFIAPKSEGRRVYALAEEKGLIDENGNLSEDPEKISELQWEYENAFGLNNLGAGIAGNIFARKNTDVKKLFDEGRRQFERRRNYRLLRDLNRNEFSYSDGEWRTFEDALVNGEYTLRSLLLGFGVGFATKNPHAAIASTSAMMYATEAGDMYADLRFNGKVKESDAANIAATYGAMATALEQLQVSRFAGFFRKNAAIPKSWREYINLGLKEGFKEYALASADETAIEVAQSTAAFAAKKWAVANADATYEQRELWEEYLESAESAIKTMPIITGGMYGAGFPFRARAYMGKMGASVMSGTKAYFRPSKVLENNTRATAMMAEADKYFNSLIEKLGQTPEDRGWLYSYYSAKTDEERSGLLAERFSDESERDEATLILQEYENFDREATREFFKSKAEIARKLKEDDQKLLNGDTTDISVLDETDENGRYVVLESAIDALGMRDNVIFADTAEELAKVSGLSLEAAEEQMARGGAKGFYESGSGNIVVIRRHFSDGADALRTFAHEYGHRIMAKIREGDIGGYNRMCDDVLSIVGGERMAREILPASYSEAGSAQYLKDARAVAEEVLMRAAERVATKKVLDARNRGIWARFKRWFKGLFEEKSLADIADENLAQIALDVLQRERRFDVKLSERSPKTSRNWRAKTPEINGAEVSGEWAIMDAGKLVASTDEGYDDRLQPRNRARQASKEQTNEIALNLDPARLNDSETTDLGAPIVDARGMVISGNGRTIAIRQAYGSERAERGDAYREFVYNRAKELGIDIPDGVKNPVLVRRVDNTGEMSMEEFAARSNKSQVAGMSVAEQAIADSRRILEADLLDIFFPDAGGNVLAASNADFYNAFLNLVGGGEAYRNRDGSVRQNLSPRIRAAVLAAMLNPERRETVERLLDNPEGYNALINGLMQSAANLAELANKPEYDLSGELSQAVELFVETRDKGQTVDEFAAQTDMFRDAPSAETMFLMRLFEENAKSSGGISGVLRQYAAECKKIDTTTQSLFGEENPTKLEKLEEAYRHYAADLSNEAGNGNLRWRDTGEPAAEEISEAQKQYEEVKSKYMGTPLWMKAPNGKPTNLTEEQWVRVRTPNFKKWFGDWETLADFYPENEIFDIDEAYRFARENLQGKEFTSKDGHTATLGRSGIDKMNSGLARGKTGNNRLHALAFANVGKLFGNSELLEAEAPRDGDPNIKQYLKFYTPLFMDGEFHLIKITAKELIDGNRLYSLEGLDIIEESEYRGQPRDSKENSISADYPDSVKNFVKKIQEIKENVSKVVDENGEPLVVYHGTPKFDRFNIFKKGSGGYLGPAIYFTNLKAYAQKYENKWGEGGNLYDVFLSLRNPLVVKSINPAKEILKTIYGKDGIYDKRSQKQSYDTKILSSADIKKLQSKGYDGVIWEYGGSKEYAVYDSSKIKSATDNIGTYSENPDIRWRLDEGAAELDARHAELYERYKGGDEAAYGEALELVADEARRNGYDVKVYHGTGADGFNVADATSKHKEFGEGNQAHGPGLYMAANRDTAEAYKYNAPVQEFRTIGGKTFEEIGISPKELNYPVFGLVDFLHSNGVDKAKEIINTRIESQTKRLKSAEKHLPKSKDGFDRDLAWETIKSAKREISNDRKTLDVIDKILSKLKESGLSISDYEYKISEGRVFDWFHNMKPDELLEEQNPNSVEKSAVGEKYKKAWFEDILPILRREYGYDGEELDSVKRMLSFHNSAKTIARNGSTILGADRFREIMLKHGIRGITYDGRQDGRVFVSFEGGATVKLQDPFTFDDDGNLIPLSERFDEANPDMRWKIDDPSPERVEKLRAARPVEIGENDYKGLYELNAKSAREYVLKKLRGRKYVNADTGDEIEIGQVGARKLLSHDRYNKDYLRSFVAIPRMIENAVYLGEEPNEKGNGKYDKYRYYACGLKIGGRDYTARLTIGESEGKWYYDQALTQIEKGDLIKRLLTLNSRVRPLTGSPNGFIDNRLISLLQENNSENSSRLRYLLRQDRRENPVIWASIVLAKQILLGRAITSARLDRVLPPERFDGTKREYAVNRAREIAERYRSDKEKFGNDLNLGVQRAENDLYWTRDVVEEMYASFRRDGEEYGIARQRLMEWLKAQRRRDLETVKGLSSEELGIDVPAAIENALQEEPARKKKEDDSKNEPQDEELESFAEDGIDDEILGSKEKLAPSSLREIIDKIRIAVTKKIKALGGDEQTRRRLYRNTLAEVLKESANNLTYGRERELIRQNIRGLGNLAYHDVNSLRARSIELKNKLDLVKNDSSLKSDYIETYNNIQGIYFGTYSGHGGVMNFFVKNYINVDNFNPSQIPDPYSIYAEHIALRIFNRGVRDTKRELSEKFEKIVSRKGKKPSRMERDDKRVLAGAVQMRVYNIKRYSEMDAAELEAEYSATVDRLENVEKNFAEDAGKGEVRSDIEDIRAEVANAVHDMKMFGNWRDKSRAQMAEGVEFLEKYIDEETEEQKARVEARKEENARRRNVFIAALRQSKRNANKDGELRKLFRGIVNNTLPFDSILSILGEAATGKTYAEFKSLSNEIVSKVNRAAENVSNECFAKKEKLYAILRECYGEDQSTALRRLLKADAKYERFSKNPETPNPMTLANVMQLYATALQKNYERNIFEHRARKSEKEVTEYNKIQDIIESINLNSTDEYSKGMLKQSRESLERKREAIVARSVSKYISELEGVLTEADKNFVAALRAEYAEALPALSAVSRRVIGLPIEQADELYMPVKVDYGGGLGEGTGGVPVVPKSLSPRVSHLRDFDETADPITLYLERVKENAQFKYFSELYIELRGIFADESLQKLIRERCGADVLKLLKESIADICTGETKGFNLKAARQASGLFAIAQLGWNLGSGVRQFLPGIFSWGAYIGTPAVLRNCASFFTPEGFRAALEIAHSETGRRRFAVGNMQIIEEMLEKPDQNRFWRLYKRYALIFNRSSDMLAIMFVGQGVYRSGVESYLKKGFSEAEAKRLAMSDMWQIAERSQASGKIQNMSAWQRRGGDLAKAIGMFSSPPQLMFAKATQDMRRAIALGIKTPEGRAAAWNAVKTLFTVSVLVEGSYAASTVLWNALLKGYFDDDDDEYILKSMITGPFGGLFLFGRLVDSLGTGHSPSAIPMEGLARPAQYTIELTKDVAVFDWDEALKDLDKLASSAFSPWRDLRKILKDEKK